MTREEALLAVRSARESITATDSVARIRGADSFSARMIRKSAWARWHAAVRTFNTLPDPDRINKDKQ
jgi:hypothetical protein